MTRYFSKPKSFYVADEDSWESPSMCPDITVCDHEPTDTGLLDENGETIWRAPNPVGFGKDEEW